MSFEKVINDLAENSWKMHVCFQTGDKAKFFAEFKSQLKSFLEAVKDEVKKETLEETDTKYVQKVEV